MPVDLREVFVHLQTQLEASLQTGHAIIEHPGAKGTRRKPTGALLLKNHLPSRYEIVKAFVVDADGNISHEIDVVIFDRYKQDARHFKSEDHSNPIAAYA